MRLVSLKIEVFGRIQGVGFRPFIYRLASQYGIKGWVNNTNEGLTIVAEGPPDRLSSFQKAIIRDKPVASRIDQIKKISIPSSGYVGFSILASEDISDQVTDISPDIAVCPECLDDMVHQIHRLNYPLINCTHCGPRFSIIQDLPYDRQKTTMSEFPMCGICQKEFEHVSDRRFHAQPVACNHCGPRYTLVKKGILSDCSIEDLTQEAASIINKGDLVAVKGIGGYNLLCDAFNTNAVNRLRIAKRRESKPFAVMFRDLESLAPFVFLDKLERSSLCSWQAPIVLLKERTRQIVDCQLADGIASGLGTLGVILPYMPFHYLLFNRLQTNAIVFTSGNITDEPIITDDLQASSVFGGITEAVIGHQRKIYNRLDDSVLRVIGGIPQLIRRSRGFVPEPIPLRFESEGILAFGAELANTICLGKKNKALLSQYIGDLKNPDSLDFQKETLNRYIKLFRHKPNLVVCDLHPDYASTRSAIRFANEHDIPVVKVQHHHAHIAACMTEHGLDEKVIGVALDGTGFGTDGNIWGSEFITCDLHTFKRHNHFTYLPLPGGDKAVEEPWRIALSWLFRVFEEDAITLNIPFVQSLDPSKSQVVMEMIRNKVNTPFSCGAGRYFDAIAALLGLCHVSGYEAEGPMKLESVASSLSKKAYPYRITAVVDLDPVLLAMVSDIMNGYPVGTIAGKFHRTIINVIFDVVNLISDKEKLSKVVLSGGVFQNCLILEAIMKQLQQAGFEVFVHEKVPANDGGIALGQLAVAAKRRLKNVSWNSGTDN